MRILAPSERRLAPARPCRNCGVMFQPNMKSVWSGRGKCCSSTCGSKYAAKLLRETWTAPTHDEGQVGRAQGYIHYLLRSGKLIRPKSCSQCGSECKPDGHHDDYSKPAEVRWLCCSCHAKAHRIAVARRRAGGRR